jgi:hypothetical protein
MPTTSGGLALLSKFFFGLDIIFNFLYGQVRSAQLEMLRRTELSGAQPRLVDVCSNHERNRGDADPKLSAAVANRQEQLPRY